MASTTRATFDALFATPAVERNPHTPAPHHHRPYRRTTAADLLPTIPALVEAHGIEHIRRCCPGCGVHIVDRCAQETVVLVEGHGRWYIQRDGGVYGVSHVS